MDIRRATRSYEDWLGGQLHLVKPHLRRKHEQMASSPFAFLRATFYRWLRFWTDIAPEFSGAPVVLSIGDLHVENFGTWRDQEGRLIWGVNDFDEAFPLPYAQDLIRLAASAHLAIQHESLSLTRQDACDAILQGYAAGLTDGGKPFVLAEDHMWLHKVALGSLQDPLQFWEKLERSCIAGLPAPPAAARALRRALPPGTPKKLRVLHRTAGLGSLGRERLVVWTNYKGSKICREAKAIAPPACAWAFKTKPSHRKFNQELLDAAVRACDPFLKVTKSWVVKRLAPDCGKIDVSDLHGERDERQLVYSMGFEAANVHLGSKGTRRAILRDLGKRPPKWLHDAAKRALTFVTNDWEEWRQGAPLS